MEAIAVTSVKVLGNEVNAEPGEWKLNSLVATSIMPKKVHKIPL